MFRAASLKPHIPIEVIEVIIDHLHSDKNSLKACTLVSRIWLPTSRFHLIPSINIHVGNYQPLLRILGAPFSRLAGSVRQIKFLSLAELDNGWLNNAIPPLAKYFSSIVSLSLIGIIWRQVNPRSTTCLRTAFPKVEKLLLLECNFSTFYQLLELLYSFKVVKDLNIVASNWDTTGQFQPPYLKISSSLNALLIDGVPGPLITWFSKQEPLCLEHFFLDEIFPRDIEDVKRILSHAASTLRIFQLRFSDSYMQMDKQPGLALDQNYHLEKIEITIVFPRPFARIMRGFRNLNQSFILPLLRSITSSRLHEIKICILLDVPDDLMDIPWRAIDDLAKEAAWRDSIKGFLIELTNMNSGAVLEEVLEEAEMIIYPGLNHIAKQGLLNVKFIPQSTGAFIGFD